MRTRVSRQFALVALACCLAQPVVAQNAALTSAEVEQHIQHVTSGLIGGVVIKGDEHVTHTLADRMTELKGPGVSIAVAWHRRLILKSLGNQRAVHALLHAIHARRRVVHQFIDAAAIRRQIVDHREGDARLLNGPKVEGDVGHASQDDIDALFD